MLRFIFPSFYHPIHTYLPSTPFSFFFSFFLLLLLLFLPFFLFIYPNTHKSIKMGYGEIDQKAINTIRVLAVSSPLFTLFYFPPSSSLHWFLPRHACPAISSHEKWETRDERQCGESINNRDFCGVVFWQLVGFDQHARFEPDSSAGPWV